ncbi:MAG TPA: chloride channel protein, partial [Parasegetibacter sp.]
MYKWPLYLIEFLLRHLKQRLSKVQFMIVMAVITGLVAGLAAVLLKLSVHYLQTFLASKVTFSFFYLLFPAIGIMICAYLIHRFYGGQFERGVAMVLKSIARRSSYIGTRHNYIHMITSSITVGMGGSAGLEAPIVATGSSIGSTVGRVNGMSYQERTLLIACGAAAGISAVFNAPIAGVIFAIEILLSETIVSYFIPLIISSVTGVLCSKIILDESVLINFFLKESFNYHNVPFYILLGIGGGFISLYYA